MRVGSRIYEALGRGNLLSMALTLSDPNYQSDTFRAADGGDESGVSVA